MHDSQTEHDYSQEAAAWVNLLVPGHFEEAEKLIAPECTYIFKGETLSGPSVVRAFVESHENACRMLDEIEYLPGITKEFGPNGALVAVEDKITLNGKTHIHNDRLLVKMKKVSHKWLVIQVQHLPIAEEQLRLKAFLDSAGKKTIAKK